MVVAKRFGERFEKISLSRGQKIFQPLDLGTAENRSHKMLTQKSWMARGSILAVHVQPGGERGNALVEIGSPKADLSTPPDKIVDVR